MIGSPAIRSAMVLGITLSFMPWASVQGQYSCHGPRVTERQTRELISAVTDEIYALDRNPLYMDLPRRDSVLLYVNPRWCGRMVYTIYKLLPVGEVLRAAWYVGRGDSLMRLATPSSPDFPPTAESVLRTIYLRDHDLASMKTTWNHVWFGVEITPDSLVVEAAKGRQALRDSL